MYPTKCKFVPVPFQGFYRWSRKGKAGLTFNFLIVDRYPGLRRSRWDMLKLQC